ncbi:hypothetical protein MHLP_03395 [Candidatus Mycoplasma haematolamae str. Purdue]|uniref:Uncharacterized protein n=1 Tax=Mycoplasma haematolamae (strain Purdue) TaxID=1212765 RepID=I7CK48_MYCHA|nr:hypothetical protein [Candidatus Mycoplasma haematolamae]AFO52259.1 hypothetical protein MHLP_03395 [Candidatus Mycoplasma haematolamae str. Purdue]
MLHTAKAKIGILIIGLGGANGAGMLTLKEDLLTSLTNWELKDLFGNRSYYGASGNLELDPASRANLGRVDLSDALSSPTLSLHSEGSINLGELGYLWGFKSTIDGIHEASALELEQLAKLELQRRGANDIAKQITAEDTRFFFSALEKVEKYAKGDSNVEELNQRERQAIETYYRTWSDLKEKGIDVTKFFKQDQEGKLTRWDNSQTFKQYKDLKKQLDRIKWSGPSIQVLGDTNKFLDGSETWGSYSTWAEWWKTAYVSKSSNWGWDSGWDSNPWKDFFVNEQEWKSFWKDRARLKKKYFEDWQKTRGWHEWDNGCFASVNGVEYFEGCYRDPTHKGLAKVIDKANANISLQMGMRVLLYMGYPLEGERPKAALANQQKDVPSS